MRRLLWIAVLPLLFALSPLAAAHTPLVAVSPGAPGHAASASSCPTFSWGSLSPSASGYELAVFALGEDGALVPEPVLRQHVAPGATSWTPPRDRCLPAGRFSWSIRELGGEAGDDESPWADAQLFSVEESGAAAELERALERVLERWLTEGRLGGHAPAAADIRRLAAEEPAASSGAATTAAPRVGTPRAPSFIADTTLFDPPDCQQGLELFTDVPYDDTRCQFIEQLANDQISTGCAAAPDRFCPDDAVTRGQLAVFLERAMRGTNTWAIEDGHDHFGQTWTDSNAGDPGLAVVNASGAGLSGASSTSAGVLGKTSSIAAAGVLGQGPSPSGVAFAGSAGVHGDSYTYGVVGTSPSTAVLGKSASGVGVRGDSDTWYGVYGASDFIAIYGLATNDVGVKGRTLSTGGSGVLGQTLAASSISLNSMTGVRGSTDSGIAVAGTSDTGIGVAGYSTDHHGVYGETSASGLAAAKFVNNGSTGPGLYVSGKFDAAASFGNHVVQFENNSATTASGPDVLALKTSATGDPGAGVNFITFFDADGPGTLGSIEGNGSGSVVLSGAGNDYAEWLAKLDPEEPLAPGDVVGLHGDRVGRETSGALRLLVVSSGPIVAGNDPGEGQRHLYARVAFVGQAPVRVRGAARVGDVLIASGDGDGTARAVALAQLTADDAGLVLGRALAAKAGTEPGLVRALVGLPDPALAAARESALLREVAELRTRLASLQRRLAEPVVAASN